MQAQRRDSLYHMNLKEMVTVYMFLKGMLSYDGQKNMACN